MTKQETLKRSSAGSFAPPPAGWHMPAEWTPHERCWLAMPTATVGWGDQLPSVHQDIAKLAATIRDFEPVTVIVPPSERDRAKALLRPDIDILEIPANDLWMRDMGPTFLVDSLGGVAATVWQFNVWGGKFSGYEEDCRLAERLASAIDMNTYPAPIVTEGGALHVDGEGTLLVTETSVLNDNRNPGLDKAEAERIFKHWLGISHVVWLPGCTTETITDGHVDGFACFVRPGVALAEQPDPSAADAGEMRENLRALRLARDAKGRSLDIGLLHRPKEVESEIGSFCDCYVNFYLANGGVVMPRFGDAEADRIAAETVAKAFPDRRVAQISIDAIAAGGGGIHCSTQQQPFGGNV